MAKRWTIISLSFLFCVAFIGTALRGIKFFDLPFQYVHLVHAHSHVAFQGWVYTVIILLVPTLYLGPDLIKKGRYRGQFLVTVGIVLGILVSFSLWGYGLYSILFSTLLQFMQYFFVFRFFKDAKFVGDKNMSISLRFVKAGLLLGILSTIGPWVVGALSANGMADSEAYHSAIYFFLHFQYNGWFIFVAIGLFFKMLERAGVVYEMRLAKRAFVFMAIAVVPAYALSLLGMSFRDFVIVPALIAAILQIIACLFFIQILKASIKKWFYNQVFWFRAFVLIAFISFMLKSVLQGLSLFPFMETIAFGSRNAIMAYMHLCLIGLISFALIATLLNLKWIPQTPLCKMGCRFLIGGFVGSEILLAGSGIGYFYQADLLFAFSASMALGILMLLGSVIANKKEESVSRSAKIS